MNSFMKATGLVATCGLVAALIAVNVADDENNPAANASSSEVQVEESFSDEEILAGLLYGTGGFAEALGIGFTAADYEASGLDKSEYDTAVDSSIREIKELYAEEVSAAVANLRSDDPLLVETGIDHMEDVATEYAEYYGVSSEDSAAPRFVTPCGIALYCYAAIGVHNTLGVTALVVANAGVVITFGLWVWFGGPSSATLSKEIAVNNVMEVLR